MLIYKMHSIYVFVFLLVALLSSGSCYRARRGLCSTRRLQIQNGDYTIRSSNSVVKYTCNRGYFLFGVDQIVCYGTIWSNDPPLCISNTCPKIQVTATLRIVESYEGSVLKFSCAVNHRLVGSDRLLCDGADWSDTAPTCEPWVPAKSCDFEKTDLCGWSHHDEDDVDWRYNSGPTKTSRTGPDHDHTLGADGKGHYMYFESSSPTKTGHKAILKSPLYSASLSIQHCLTFWYHVYGTGDIGDLEVFVIRDNVLLDKHKSLFLIDHNIGNEWKNETINITRQSGPFQIYFVGTRGSSYRSDFAIDDVSLYPCGDTSTTTTSATREKTIKTTTVKGTTKPTIPTTVPTIVRTTIRTTLPTAPPTIAQTTKASRTSSTPSLVTSTKVPIKVPSTKTTVRKTDTHTAPSSKKVTYTVVTLTPIINPNIPVKIGKMESKSKGGPGDVVYILVGVGLVFAIAVIVGVGIFFYRKDKRRHNVTGEGCVNPVYSMMKNDEAAVSFASGGYEHY